MENKSEEFKKRMIELSNRAYQKGVYVFTDFLNPTELCLLKDMNLPVDYTSCGGCDFAERQMVMFGETDYKGEFPLSIIKITPASIKFCKPVTHRDFLGSLLAIGIERCKLGDIFTDGKIGYAVADEKLTEFIIENLKSVSSNAVFCEIVSDIPPGFAPVRERSELIVGSLRLDVILSRLYALSREKSLQTFKEGRVSVNGKVTENNSGTVKTGDIISVRGYGKFCFIGENGRTKKDKIFITVEKYK